MNDEYNEFLVDCWEGYKKFNNAAHLTFYEYCVLYLKLSEIS